MITKAQKLTLREDGFLPSEIMAFSTAKTPSGEKQQFNFDSNTFSAARQSRREYIKRLLEDGWTLLEAKSQVARYYKIKRGKSPFDFLKLEYAPVVRITRFVDAVKRKIRKDATRTLGYSYGRKPRRKAYKRSVLPARPGLMPARPVIRRKRS